MTQQDAERELLDLQRLTDLLIRYVGKIDFIELPKVSPMAIPIVLNVRAEIIKGSGREALLEHATLYDEAESMLAEVREMLEQAGR